MTADVAFIGVCKNAGKTTALNSLSAQWSNAGATVGLLSVGVDGESVDAVFGFPKPPIVLRSGMLIVTGETAAARSRCDLELLRPLAISGVLGRLGVYVARSAGTALLAGVRYRRDIPLCTSALRATGASRVAIDGGFDRAAAASPTVARHVVLSTGLAAGGTIESATAALNQLLTQLSLPAAAPSLLPGAQHQWIAHRVITPGEGSFDLAPGPNATWNDLPPHPSAFDEESIIWLPAALTNRRAEALLTWPRAGMLGVADATRITCNREMLERLARYGWRLAVAEPARVAAVTTNPSGPGGASVPPRELLDLVATSVPGVTTQPPVLDVVARVARRSFGSEAPVPVSCSFPISDESDRLHADAG